ncbi:MAG: hypothetical protein K0R46_2653 [Herbinix sp.]|jgi:hypothetical protein|nr:hypothetical protein [Herbinix sp.]
MEISIILNVVYYNDIVYNELKDTINLWFHKINSNFGTKHEQNVVFRETAIDWTALCFL